ncbi:hypothetical protein LJB89_03870 [Tyzzerella sp. OttesenSCG-928-J15]|nr:hypothetical protein [Tyzzerella sp. OttesenSCG-928-J15]
MQHNIIGIKENTNKETPYPVEIELRHQLPLKVIGYGENQNLIGGGDTDMVLTLSISSPSFDVQAVQDGVGELCRKLLDYFY